MDETTISGVGTTPSAGETGGWTGRPRRCTPSELAKAGVELLDPNRLLLACTDCGQRWQPMVRPGGRLPRGYWQCPRCRGLV